MQSLFAERNQHSNELTFINNSCFYTVGTVAYGKAKRTVAYGKAKRTVAYGTAACCTVARGGLKFTPTDHELTDHGLAAMAG
jgi:hypothetical protein